MLARVTIMLSWQGWRSRDIHIYATAAIIQAIHWFILLHKQMREAQRYIYETCRVEYGLHPAIFICTTLIPPTKHVSPAFFSLVNIT